MFAHLLQDFRFGLRLLLAKPGFALAAILTLALGIGANTLVFTLIDGVYLSTLPYRDADSIVDVYATNSKDGGGVDNVSIPDYVDLHTSVPAFADSALYTDASFNLVASGAPERLQGLRATPSLFSTLGAGWDGPGAVGKNTVAIPKIHGRKLRPGRYRLTMTVTDAAGNSRTVNKSFTIKPKPKKKKHHR